jgi:tetratricopeptide (TPR) repeat protein
VLTEQGVWDFAESLMAQGEYYRAISEYKRLVYFFPASPHLESARLRIGEAYLNGGEPKEAVQHFSALLRDPGMAPRRPEALFLRGIAWLELDGSKPYPLREGNVQAALTDLRAIPTEWPGRPRADGFLKAMAEPPELPSKSPGLAAAFSALLPGAGSLYVGRYEEAALAFFVNAVFIYATVNAFQHGREGLGVALGVPALAFYGGAIYAAANGAHKTNDRTRTAYLEQQRVRFGLVPQPGGFSGVIEGRF